MYKLIRRILFLFNAEMIHDVICKLLKWPFVASVLRLIYHYEHPALHSELHGLKFKNPIGLAAGFDKNANLINKISSLGFGFLEIIFIR